MQPKLWIFKNAIYVHLCRHQALPYPWAVSWEGQGQATYTVYLFIISTIKYPNSSQKQKKEDKLIKQCFEITYSTILLLASGKNLWSEFWNHWYHVWSFFFPWQTTKIWILENIITIITIIIVTYTHFQLYYISDFSLQYIKYSPAANHACKDKAVSVTMVRKRDRQRNFLPWRAYLIHSN